MRFLVLLLLAVGAMCDMKSQCESKCRLVYEDSEQTANACVEGCGQRDNDDDNDFGGLSAIPKCYKFCGTRYENATETELDGCRYACSLPSVRVQSIQMSFGNGRKPEVRVSKHEGLSFDDLSEVLLRPEEVNGNLLALQPPADSSSKDSDEENAKDSHDESDEDEFEFPDMNSDAWLNWQKNIATIFERFREETRKMRQEMLDSDRVLGVRAPSVIHSSRPSGHDQWSFLGDDSVGNEDVNGEPIILTHPISDRQAEMTRFVFVHDRRAQFLHWTLVAVGVMALLMTVCAAALFLRTLRNNSYRRMRSDGTTFAVIPPVAQMGNSADALPVKKVPEEGWVTETTPAGVPPPAYDQVSVHSLKKEVPEESHQ